MDSLYYECHVTIAPAFDREHIFKAICGNHNFRVAELFMKKGEVFEPSKLDSFCTAHDKYCGTLRNRLISLVRELKENKFEVRRYKIEQVVLDSRVKDEECLLEKRDFKKDVDAVAALYAVGYVTDDQKKCLDNMLVTPIREDRND